MWHDYGQNSGSLEGHSFNMRTVSRTVSFSPAVFTAQAMCGEGSVADGAMVFPMSSL